MTKSVDVKKKVLELRKEGLSFSKIINQLDLEGIHISKGTIHNWLKEDEEGNI